MDVQQDVHALLRGRTRCLAQIVEISRSFLEMAEASPERVVELVAEFDAKRGHAFHALELIDRRIEELASLLPASQSRGEQSRAIFAEQRDLAHALQGLDSRIVATIEQARGALSRDVQDQTRLKDKLSKFKSQWMPDQGEGLDQTL